MYKQKWNQLVELHAKAFLEPESVIQNLWESAFTEVFGYSRLFGELDCHRTIRIGSIDRVIPDIIIKNAKEDLFIVELKQHNKYFYGGMERQLFSYLKQLKMNVGILICNKLYVYDYDVSKNDDNQSKLEITFEKDNPDGIKFIELFSKGNFKKSAISELVQEKAKREKVLKEIEEKINNEYLFNLMKSDLLKTYSENEIENVIKNYNISITKKGFTYSTPTPTPTRSTVIKGSNFSSVLQPRAKISKHTAKILFKQEDIDVIDNYNFGSLNKTNLCYWVNPNIDVINYDWNIILNDNAKRELHLFYIPASSISLSQLKVRHDQPTLIDLQIRYNNPTFEDGRSGFKFGQYLVKTIKY